MPKYNYKARDPRGQVQAGVVDASDEASALKRLRTDGLTVTDIRITSEIINVEQVRAKQAAKSVGRDEVIAFSSQLSVMLDTGVPLSDALDAFLTQAKETPFAKIVQIVADRINSGVSFSQSLTEFPKVFPPLMMSLIQASEATGALGGMLGRASVYLGKDRKTIKQIRGALTYPAVMVGMAVLVTVFLVGWVLPRFAKIYESKSAALPTPTRILLDVSDFVTGNWAILLTGVFVATASIVFAMHTDRGRRLIDTCKIRAPIFGPIFTNFYVSRSTRTLGTLLDAGVTLTDSIRIVRGVTTNMLWDDLWDEVEVSLAEGRTMAECVLNTRLIPPSAGQMIAAGERTGRLPEVLEKIANVTEEDLDESIKTGTQLIEPLVIIFMGFMIGGIAIALLLPIFTMGSMMAK